MATVDRYTISLLEETREYQKAILEILSSWSDLPKKVNHLEESNDSHSSKIKVFTAVVTDQSKDIGKQKRRLMNHEARIKILEAL
jgi:hypothetical protein